MDRKTLADGLTASAQLEIADFAELARQGVTLVINNRPDSEKLGQLSAAQGKQAAEKVGLAYRHIPVTISTLRTEDIDQFGRAVAAAIGPVHAHCALGHRSATLWVLSQIRCGAMTRPDAVRWGQQHQVDLADGSAWLDRQPT
ncbi:TIGR01244 family sulfur transferase [Lichenicoccus roseus]|uniref:TIGR01244 family phosphatase n=1 Tax=Lichenicoccus roseus TaxID=2683649 RepID=A0A5R9J3K8_9PROT|nr:TIGR01244 family sulfur transferase [Lichenicoccus roseus]TLU71087.1 TIGR01244 family phosphatase [Lichenicoccus roseus]